MGACVVRCLQNRDFMRDFPRHLAKPGFVWLGSWITSLQRCGVCIIIFSGSSAVGVTVEAYIA